MKESVIGFFLRFIPKNLLSFWVGRLVSLRLPQPWGAWVVKWFAGRYRIRMDEAEFPIGHYPSIAELFTRKLKAGIRPVGEGFVHPVDGKLSLADVTRSGQLVQVKGVTYGLSEFLSLGSDEASEFEGGWHLNYYLCPTDYHRVHSPVAGEIVGYTYVPGRLWPVNPWSVSNISQLFAINERVVIWLKSGEHKIALVMVGATNVGKMTLSFDERLITNQRQDAGVLTRNFLPSLPLEKGQELGIFNMGSTVIMVTPKGYLNNVNTTPRSVQMGQSL